MIDQDAPVYCSESIEINADSEKIWRLMSDIENWPVWNNEIKSVTLHGDFAVGTKFSWKTGNGTISSTLETLEPLRLMSWSGKLLGINAVHVWRITPSSGGSCTVTTEESWNGLLPKLFKKSSKKALSKAVSTGLRFLKEAAQN